MKNPPNTNQSSQAQNYKQIAMRIRKDSPLYEAIDLCQRLTGFPASIYAQIALAEKLKNDGYLDELEEQKLIEERHRQYNTQPSKERKPQTKKPSKKAKQKKRSVKKSTNKNSFPILISQRDLYSKASNKLNSFDESQN